MDVTGSPQYSHSHGRLLAEKERERLAHEQQKQAHHLLVPPPVGASPRASPHHAYAPAAPPSARDISSTLRGDARDYEPHDGRHHAPSRDEMPRPPSGRLVTPPPAHSHHKAPAVTSEHAVRMHDRIYQEHREAERREAERRHPTPPGRSSAASPYGMPMTQPGVAARPPPPLINIGDRRGPSPRPTHGSISQGTPVSGQQVAQPRGGVGSISMGTPRFDPAAHHRQRDSRDVGGSISRGTPVGYDAAVAAARSQAETAARAGQAYEAASMANPISMQQYNRALEVYRNLPPQAASMLPLIHQQQLQEMNSRAQLAGDFFTAQQMEEQRRKEHDKPGSPRSRESNTAPPQFAPGAGDPRNPLLTAAMPQMLNYMTAGALPPQPPKRPASSSPMAPRDAGVRASDARDAARERDAAARERDMREYEGRARSEMLQQSGLMPGWPPQRGGGSTSRQPSPHPQQPPHPKLAPPRANVIVEMSRSHSPRNIDTSPRYAGGAASDKAGSREGVARPPPTMTTEQFQKFEQENFLTRQAELRRGDQLPQSRRVSSNQMARTAEKYLKMAGQQAPPTSRPPSQEMRSMGQAAMAEMRPYQQQPPPQQQVCAPSGGIRSPWSRHVR